MTSAPRDENRITALVGTSSTDGKTPVLPYVDPTTHRLYVDLPGGSTGTVTSVGVTTANGVSGTVLNPTSTPTITLALGAITPTSVNGLKISTTTGTITVASGKTLTVNGDTTLGLAAITFDNSGGVVAGASKVLTISDTASISGSNTGDQTLASLGAQPQLSGTGFIKATGTTISYDNSTYLTTTGNGGSLTGLTATQVSLGNVDNTSDATKNSAVATLTNKRITLRSTAIASSTTPTINTDNFDAYSITALAGTITAFGVTGSPNNFDKLIVRLKDNGTGYGITWSSSFEAKGVALPTTTTASKVTTVGFLYDSVTNKWGCVASVTEA